MHLKISSAEWRPFWTSLNALTLTDMDNIVLHITNSKYENAEVVYSAWDLQKQFIAPRQILFKIFFVQTLFK